MEDHDNPYPKANSKSKPVGKLLRIRGREKFFRNSLVQGNGYLSDATADVKFICESGKVVRAHRLLLCLASEYFIKYLQDQDPAEISVVYIPEIPSEVMIIILTMIYHGDNFLIPRGLEDKVIEWLQEFDLSSQIVLDDASGCDVNNLPVHPPAAVELEDDSDDDSSRPFKKRKLAKPENVFERRGSSTVNRQQNSNSGTGIKPMQHSFQSASYGEPPLLDNQSSQRFYGAPPELDSMMDIGNYPMPGTSQSMKPQLGVTSSNRSVMASDVVKAVFKLPTAFKAASGNPSSSTKSTTREREQTPIPQIPIAKRGRGRPRKDQSVAPTGKPSAAAESTLLARAQSEFRKPRAQSSSRGRSTSRARSRSRSRIRSRSHVVFDINDKHEDYRGENVTKLIGQNPRSARLQQKLQDFNKTFSSDGQ